jgi:small subunit ribosomal protein S2
MSQQAIKQVGDTSSFRQAVQAPESPRSKRKDWHMATTQVDIKQLLEAGAHFGHKTARWHPKMAPFIHSKRDGTHIIDLTKTVDSLETALQFLTKTAGDGKQVLLVGTKRQAQDIIKQAAEETGMPFVTERWLGGMLTNWNTIGGRVKHLKDLEARMASGELANKYNKLEIQRFQEEIDQLNLIYGGIKDMNSRPGAIFIVDIINDANAVREATKIGIPIVAIVDTNADPTQVKYPIPANDDAIKTIQLITDYVKSAISTGKASAKKAEVTPDKDEK